MAPNPQSLIPNPDLDQLVRRVDEDRWLASRFAPPDVRARLIALYAVNYEIARTAEVVREPPLGAIRLEWWRGLLDEIAGRRAPQDPPALAALAKVYAAAAAGPLQAVVAARHSDFESAPFADWAELDRYVDATAGHVMRLAVRACVDDLGSDLAPVIERAARAWGYVGLLRADPVWRARGRSFYPRQGGDRAELIARAEAACTDLRESEPPPGSVFPALGYAALARSYLRALREGKGEPFLLSRQLSLVAAAATGRL